MPQAITSSFSITRTGEASPAAGEIGGTHRKAIDVGAVERRHVDRRRHVFGQRAAERIGERALLCRHRARKQRGFEARQRILARQNGQELVLIDVAIFGAMASWSFPNSSQSRNI